MSKDTTRKLMAALTLLESRRSSSPGASRRQFRRFVVRGEGQLQPLSIPTSETPVMEVQVRDVGWGGVGFVCTASLSPNSRWRINLTHHGEVLAQQTMIIRYCTPVVDDVWLVGGQFCAEAGTMMLLGVDLGQMVDSEAGDGQGGVFLTPEESV